MWKLETLHVVMLDLSNIFNASTSFSQYRIALAGSISVVEPEPGPFLTVLHIRRIVV